MTETEDDWRRRVHESFFLEKCGGIKVRDALREPQPRRFVIDRRGIFDGHSGLTTNTTVQTFTTTHTVIHIFLASAK